MHPEMTTFYIDIRGGGGRMEGVQSRLRQAYTAERLLPHSINKHNPAWLIHYTLAWQIRPSVTTTFHSGRRHSANSAGKRK